ncbi:Serine/threonine protein kinase [Glycomyces sambucus]|uniref:non-specific serine/threonine protein kinase n=2 Tax=Glycomyces sambucus TaxID=380244 RepID=A0A1G9CN14_9ACTN|nr:Serine/threonine protein kinase [Glycomyces sambucus]
MVFDHVISILDCCHSGSASTWANSRPLASTDIEREIRVVNESRCILAACRPEQGAYGNSNRGVFTTRLTNALMGDAANWEGQVTLMSLFDCVAKAMPQGSQTPVFKGDVAGTVVIGSGFPKRLGPPVAKAEMTRIVAKAQAMIDRYHNLERRELSDWETRLSGGSRRCSKDLEPLIHWFESTEKSKPQIKANEDWKKLRARLLVFQQHLSDLTVGEETRFGKIVTEIGWGAFGRVWEIQPDEESRKALKVFHGNEIHDQTKVSRFENGYNSMRKLDHPRVVEVFEISKAPFGFLMQFVDGGNLRDAYIPRDGNAELIVRLMLDICETVQHAHSKGVLHRDIKPENIIIKMGERGELIPYLTDFDLAYHETNRTMTTTAGNAVGGVVNYAAPEQMYAPQTVAARNVTVDVYSLAQLMFFLIVGEDPTAADPSQNILKLTRVLSEWIDDRASSPILEAYQKASLKDPGERPQTVTEFAASFRTAEAFIQLASESEDVPESDFWRRVGNAYAGLNNYEADSRSMRAKSVSGQVEVNGRFRHVSSRGIAEAELEFSLTQNILLTSFKSSKKARERLNVRLDKILAARFGHTVRRHHGHKGVYQVFVSASGLRMHITSVTKVCEVIAACVDGIERG